MSGHKTPSIQLGPFQQARGVVALPGSKSISNRVLLLAALANGVTVDGVRYGPIEAGLDARKGDTAWLTVSLKEGRNREIRKVMRHLGLTVTRLIRVAYGPFQLGTLPRGGIEQVGATHDMRDRLRRVDVAVPVGQHGAVEDGRGEGGIGRVTAMRAHNALRFTGLLALALMFAGAPASAFSTAEATSDATARTIRRPITLWPAASSRVAIASPLASVSGVRVSLIVSTKQGTDAGPAMRWASTDIT